VSPFHRRAPHEQDGMVFFGLWLAFSKLGFSLVHVAFFFGPNYVVRTRVFRLTTAGATAGAAHSGGAEPSKATQRIARVRTTA